jgi:hypothetical protein
MKKRAHIPHNYEMSFEIRQGGIPCLWRWCAATLEKQSHMSHETVGFEMGLFCRWATLATKNKH